MDPATQRFPNSCGVAVPGLSHCLPSRHLTTRKSPCLTIAPGRLALTGICHFRYVSSMFLYKLHRFGYGTQKALSGSRSKHVSETSVAYCILTEMLFKRTSSHACPLFSLSRSGITWSRARPSRTVIEGSTDICLIRVTIDIAVIVLMIFLPGWSN